jgi:hypothetical protein
MQPAALKPETTRRLCHWLIVIIRPPTVMVPLRDTPEVFDETEYLNVPLPEPLPDFPTLIQDTLLTAVQGQPLPVVIDSVADPPKTDMVSVVGERT